jgi:hypothetical protein
MASCGGGAEVAPEDPPLTRGCLKLALEAVRDLAEAVEKLRGKIRA